MKKTLRIAEGFFFVALCCLGAISPTLASARPQDDNNSVKQDVKDAGHSTKEAGKTTGHDTKKETKKIVHKSAHKTAHTADKVADKTKQ